MGDFLRRCWANDWAKMQMRVNCVNCLRRSAVSMNRAGQVTSAVWEPWECEAPVYSGLPGGAGRSNHLRTTTESDTPCPCSCKYSTTALLKKSMDCWQLVQGKVEADRRSELFTCT